MTDVVIRAAILIGAPGAGKSSVLDALSTSLEADGVGFGAIESEQFSRGWPWLTAAEWMPQLAAVVALQREAGRDTFLVAATPENDRELQAVIEAVAADRVVVACLTVPPDVASARVAAREPDAWPSKAALVAHAGTLARVVPSLPGIDESIGTDGRSAVEVAGVLRGRLEARGVLGPR